MGFAQTQMHMKQLTKYLIRRTWAKMVDPESDHYEPELAKILQEKKVMVDNLLVLVEGLGRCSHQRKWCGQRLRPTMQRHGSRR